MRGKLATINFEDLEAGDNIREEAKKKSIKELAKTIETTGWVSPPVVEKVGAKYRIIAGERRFHAVNLLREKDPSLFEKIKVEIVEGTELEKLTIQAVENINREDFTIYEIIKYIVILKEKFLLDNKEISKRVGKSDNYVGTLYRVYQKIHPDILDAVKRNTKIPVEDLIEWSKKPSEEQKECFESWLGKKQPTNDLLEMEPTPKRKMLAYRKAERLLNHLVKVKANPQMIMLVKYLMGLRKTLPGKLNPYQKTGQS